MRVKDEEHKEDRQMSQRGKSREGIGTDEICNEFQEGMGSYKTYAMINRQRQCFAREIGHVTSCCSL